MSKRILTILNRTDWATSTEIAEVMGESAARVRTVHRVLQTLCAKGLTEHLFRQYRITVNGRLELKRLLEVAA